MRQVAFQVVHRDRDSINGTHSATWQYMDGPQQVQVSVDFPFVGFHALEVCYLLTGCSLTEPVASVEVQGNAGSATPRVLNEILFVNALADQCYVCYTALDREGQSVSGGNGRLSRGTVNEGAPPISFQVQVFVEGCDGLNNEQRDRYRRVVLEVCEAILPVIQTLPGN